MKRKTKDAPTRMYGQQVSGKAMDAHARSAARRKGLIARKTRWHSSGIDLFGSFVLIDARGNYEAIGMSAKDVILYCADA